MNDPARADELIHDIRNRLAVARANIEAVIDGKLEATPARLKIVLQSLDQLAALLNDLKAAPAASMEIHPIEIDVCQLLDREYRGIAPVAKARDIDVSVFRCPVPHAACKRFIGDPVRIGQIVSNVLLNAVRYTPEGGSIRVDCMHQADQLQISIADSGPGVREDERDTIFMPGVRGSAGQTTGGTGYGLAIAKEFVEAHGGSISVAPGEYEGARFIIRLPGTLLDGAGPAHCRQCAVGPQPGS